MNEKQEITISRDLILFLVLSLKIVPVSWIYSLDESYDIKRQKLHSIVHNLQSEGFLSIGKTLSPEKFIFLTRKGYEKANQGSLVSYRYNGWYKAKKRVPSIKEDHHYIIFRFLLEYFSKHKSASRVYTDYDRECKLEYLEVGQNTFVKPDAMLRPAEEDSTRIIALEADTNKETQKELYDKILKYLLASQHYHQIDGVNEISVYFIFASEDRSQSVFSLEKGLIGSFFKDVNRFTNSKVKKTMLIKDVVQTLKDGRLKVFSGVFNEGFDNYQQVDMLGLIYKQNSRWQGI